MVPYCYLFLLSVFILWLNDHLSWKLPFVNCCQFMYLVTSLLILRAGYGIWLYQCLIIGYLLTLLNTSVNWPLNSSAFLRFDWANPFHSSFSGVEYLGCLFFLTIDVPIEVSGVCLTSPTKLFTYISCCFLTSALISLLNVSNFDLSCYCLYFLPLYEFYFFCESLFLSQVYSRELKRPTCSFSAGSVYPPSLE